MDKGIVRSQHDQVLFIAICVLTAIGLVMVYSASYAYASLTDADPEGVLRRQLTAVGLGLVALLVLSYVPSKALCRLAPASGMVAMGLLLLALGRPVGPEETKRFITLIPGLTLQPSTIGGVALISCLAALGHWYAGIEDRYGRFVAIGLSATAGMCLLILVAPNLSTTLLTATTAIVVLLIAGLKPRDFLCSVGFVVLGGAIAAWTTSYMGKRIAEHLALLRGAEPGYQVTHALIGLGSGGALGKGLCRGVEKFGYLPEVHNDMIFAAIGEELGLVMTLLIVALYGLVLIRGFRAALGAPTLFGRYLAAGLTTLITGQAVINMLVVTAMVPVTGLPLPFVSAGGTSVAVLLGAAGLILSVSREYTEEPREVADRRADTDSNRGNGRTRVSGSGRGRFASRIG